jgi:hypothetical protein
MACDDNSTCKGQYYDFAEAAYPKSLTPVAIAKDGHIIWGPYNSNGEEWDSCDVDLCNGAVIDGTYGYASTSFHPYFVGCWGPGNDAGCSQECSSNPRSCSNNECEASNAMGLNALMLFGISLIMMVMIVV